MLHDLAKPLTPAESPFILSSFEFSHADDSSSDLVSDLFFFPLTYGNLCHAVGFGSIHERGYRSVQGSKSRDSRFASDLLYYERWSFQQESNCWIE